MTTHRSFWSVVRTHRQKESIAIDGLKRQGFEPVCPVQWKTVRRARRLHDRKAPLFPGYLFVAIEPDVQRWQSINSTRGVQYLLSTEGQPARLPGGFVEGLLSCLDDEGVFTPPCIDLAPGQQVRVRAGAFADLIGRVETLDEGGRVRLLLDLMAREVRVTMPAENLQTVH